MKLFILLFISLFVVLVLFIFLTYTKSQKPTAIIENKTFFLDVAKTDKEKEIGLAKYDKLPENMAMLFIFSYPNYYSFWMKNMKFPIDIIYIKDNKIVDIFTDVPYPKTKNEQLPIYTTKQKANFVLEINANLSKKYNFKIGSGVKINNL